MIRDPREERNHGEEVKASHGRRHCRLQLDPSCNCEPGLLFVRMKLSLVLDFCKGAAIKLESDGKDGKSPLRAPLEP